ncbi:unnamed protein product [Nezara viridula]|uniref:Uncharacterized protein n=1 Tax=Nezara viridula TaxID=85310 RepID=A0A9P0HI38_NEZVI|nr:unnamed protein product [Nezara viridula]
MALSTFSFHVEEFHFADSIAEKCTGFMQYTKLPRFMYSRIAQYKRILKRLQILLNRQHYAVKNNLSEDDQCKEDKRHKPSKEIKNMINAIYREEKTKGLVAIGATFPQQFITPTPSFTGDSKGLSIDLSSPVLQRSPPDILYHGVITPPSSVVEIKETKKGDGEKQRAGKV